MFHRTDAAGRAFVVAGLILVGCAPLARREQSKATPPASLAENSLAITTPPMSGDVVTMSGQVPQPPVVTAPVSQQEADPVRRLHREAAASYAKLTCYIARLRRREVIQGRAKPEEVLVFKFRERPYSVHFKWLGDEGRGREVVFVRGQWEDKLHILTANNDIP